MWPTPRGEDSESAGNHPGASDSLTGVTDKWMTPTGNPATYTGGNAPGYLCLPGQAQDWQTPGSDSFRSRGGERKDEMGLDQQARWATPTSRDWKDGSDPSVNVETNGLLGRQAPRFHQDPETPPPGDESSQTTPNTHRQWPTPTSMEGGPNGNNDTVRAYRENYQIDKRALNPVFVEMLMGWRPGWTSLAPLASGSPETESYLSAPNSPSAPSGDNLWQTPTATERVNDWGATVEPSEGAKARYEAGEIARLRTSRAPTLTSQVDAWDNEADAMASQWT